MLEPDEWAKVDHPRRRIELAKEKDQIGRKVMARPPSIVTEYEQFEQILARARRVFRLDERMPERVFARAERDFLFCDFVGLMTPDLWPALTQLARWHGDERVEMLVLDPEIDFYVDQQRFPAVSLSVEDDDDAYWAAIGHESTVEMFASIAASAEVVAVTGPSGAWGCWGERSPGVAVFQGFVDAGDRAAWATSFAPVMEYGPDLYDFLTLAFLDETVPDEYAARLAENYSPRG